MASETAEPLFKALVVDDDDFSRTLIASYCLKLGFQVVRASDGQMAVEQYQRELPDLIFMDIAMPRMDGLEAARQIKALQKQWCPIIFLTGMNAQEDLVRALESGGDDFLNKPLNFVVLQAKVLSLKRTLLLNQEVARQARRLQAYHDATQEELLTARDLIDQLVYSPMRPDPAFEYWTQPAELLSGDVIAMARTPSGVMHVMLADGIGHGLSAAINVMPITPVFYNMTSRGHPLVEILREMNQTVRSLLPADRFISALLLSFDPEKRLIEIWNGGIPSAYFLDEKGCVVYACPSRNFPLGLRLVNDYEAEIMPIAWHAGLRLVCFSDGLIEAANGAQELFGHERLLATLKVSPIGQELDSIKAAVMAHMAGMSNADDISVALVRLERFELNATPGAGSERKNHWDHWRFGVSLGPEELRSMDPVPLMIETLEHFHLSQAKRAEAFMVLSELVSNALDHGLLQLDSALKTGVDTDAYYDERLKRLRALASGEIHIDLETRRDGDDTLLFIRVTDTGAGFDLAALPGDQQALSSGARSGRGIALIRKLARAISYNARGNGVEVLLPL